MITWDDFEKVELRIGTIIEVTDFPEARKPAYKLRVDFGSDIGIRKSSAQLTDLYGKEELVGKQVLAVTNFPPPNRSDHFCRSAWSPACRRRRAQLPW